VFLLVQLKQEMEAAMCEGKCLSVILKLKIVPCLKDWVTK